MTQPYGMVDLYSPGFVVGGGTDRLLIANLSEYATAEVAVTLYDGSGNAIGSVTTTIPA